MRKLTGLTLAVLACALAACSPENSGTGSVDASGLRGSLIQNPPLRTASLTATDFLDELNASTSGQQLLLVAGVPTCGIDFHYIQYGTVGGAGEPTTASGALMVPTGSSAPCTGPRPILLYAHGTATDKRYNLADIADPANAASSEGALLAAMFAAQGYIVVAPNYAGYDSSPLGYHPFLNADQQSKEMIDALTAARTAIGHVFAAGTTDNGKLFVSGYSEGGHVAMATVRALQGLGATVTASAPMSGPYATEAFGDAVLFGSVNLGSTVFVPLITTSYQKAYGNLYTATTDIYEAAYATGIEALLPTSSSINVFAQNLLPQTALFSSTTPQTGDPTLDAALAVPNDPLFSLGFGASNLVLNSVRLAYALDAIANPDGGATIPPQPGAPIATTAAYPLRAALRSNDMRLTPWAPNAPMLLCGGKADPTVFFSVNTETMGAFWAGLPVGLVTMLDVDSAPTGPTDPFAAAKLGFAIAKANTSAAAGGGAAGQNAVVQAYHGALVPPFCSAAALGFFSQF